MSLSEDAGNKVRSARKRRGLTQADRRTLTPEMRDLADFIHLTL
jgi:transcriptional regulator with XRE-family HTH domain